MDKKDKIYCSIATILFILSLVALIFATLPNKSTNGTNGTNGTGIPEIFFRYKLDGSEGVYITESNSPIIWTLKSPNSPNNNKTASNIIYDNKTGEIKCNAGEYFFSIFVVLQFSIEKNNDDKPASVQADIVLTTESNPEILILDTSKIQTNNLTASDIVQMILAYSGFFKVNEKIRVECRQGGLPIEIKLIYSSTLDFQANTLTPDKNS